MLGSHTLARQGVLGRCVPARAGRASPRGGSGTPGGRALARGSPDGSTAALASPPAPATEGSWVTAVAGGARPSPPPPGPQALPFRDGELVGRGRQGGRGWTLASRGREEAPVQA